MEHEVVALVVDCQAFRSNLSIDLSQRRLNRWSKGISLELVGSKSDNRRLVGSYSVFENETSDLGRKVEQSRRLFPVQSHVCSKRFLSESGSNINPIRCRVTHSSVLVNPTPEDAC